MENPWDVIGKGGNDNDGDEGFLATVQVTPWFCVLQKGVGKIPYDPAAHDIKQRRVAVTITAATERSEIVREFLDWDAGWKQFAASCERLGIFPHQFAEPRLARVRFADILDRAGNPQVYVGRDGLTKTRTTIEVVALVEEEAEDLPAQPAQPAQSDQSAPGKPQNATERVAFQWLADAAARAAAGTTAEDLIRGLGALTKKPAVRDISQVRWLELAEHALIASGKAPF